MYIKQSRTFCRSIIVCSILFTAAGLAQCKRSKPNQNVSVNNVAKLPPLVVRDDSTGLTFSYITNDGGFQLVKRVEDVPYEARDVVRIWSDISGDGVAGPSVYVADLRTKLPDGTYKIDVIPRTQFDNIAQARRAPKQPKTDPTKDVKGNLTVIVYGADWCQPCKDAEQYLKAKKIPFIHKDVDKSDSAEAAELQDKLRAAGIRAHSIPVFDVGGKMIVGFSTDSLDHAIAEALKK